MKGGRRVPIHFFRTFPSGMAGLGLFLLRVITALTLGYAGYSLQQGSSVSAFGFARVFGILLPLVGLLMIVGFATVISGILSCALLLISFDWVHVRPNGLSAIAAGLSLVLILLGPGAYSLDARFFGWRRIEITRRKPKP